MIKEISKEELLNLLTGNFIGSGNYGLIVEQNDRVVYKVYYNDLRDTHCNGDMDTLTKELEEKKSNKNYLKYKEELLKKIEVLGNTKSNVIKGMLVCEDYPVGVVMKNLSTYKDFRLCFSSLSVTDQVKVLGKLKEIINELYENNISLFDFKADNIMIDTKTLDVKLVDLDGEATAYGMNENITFDECMEFIEKNSKQTL